MTDFVHIFKQNTRETHQQRHEIGKILAQSPATAAQIAQKLNVPTKIVMWNLLGMMRWGEVEITGEEHHEVVFSLKEA